MIRRLASIVSGYWSLLVNPEEPTAKERQAWKDGSQTLAIGWYRYRVPVSIEQAERVLARATGVHRRNR